jgi:hypothetical protein
MSLLQKEAVKTFDKKEKVKKEKYSCIFISYNNGITDVVVVDINKKSN